MLRVASLRLHLNLLMILLVASCCGVVLDVWIEAVMCPVVRELTEKSAY